MQISARTKSKGGVLFGVRAESPLSSEEVKLILSLSLRGEMAQQVSQLDQANFCCPICLDLLKDPVTIPCGHSYCMRCIRCVWDGEDEKNIHSCPQCRQTFIPRPVLVRNTMFANLVEELEKTELHSAPADHCAGPADVGCDFCSGRKLKAIKSCLQCLVSYCDQHLQPHYDSPGFKNHKLVDPSKKLQENICSRHGEVMKMFCCTDQKSICYLCSVDEHKGHDTVSAAAERTERQRELGESQLQVQQRIHFREKDVKVLQKNLMAMNRSADKAVRDSEAIFNQLIRLTEKKRSDVKQQIRSQQKTEVCRAKELQENLEQEIAELRRKDAELQQLSHTEDHIQFLRNYTSLLHLSKSTQSATIKIRPLRAFEEVVASVSKVTDKLQNILREEWTKNSPTLTDVGISLSPAQPKTRAEFLRYSRQITLDPNTGSKDLSLSEVVVPGFSQSPPSIHQNIFASLRKYVPWEERARGDRWGTRSTGEPGGGVVPTLAPRRPWKQSWGRGGVVQTLAPRRPWERSVAWGEVAPKTCSQGLPPLWNRRGSEGQ
ncbi:tripartite motif-containing protein 16-like [Genypterus blacodes]|uniref:tripartite motif-containing protein 16-like n=1 Tax=Genypterus blacodes TaxID=154954 RepID=UPI003F75DCA8